MQRRPTFSPRPGPVALKLEGVRWSPPSSQLYSSQPQQDGLAAGHRHDDYSISSIQNSSSRRRNGAGSGENSSAHTYGVAQARPHAGSVTAAAAASDARAEVINAQLMSDLEYRNGGPRTYRGRARRLFYAETITSAFSLRFTPPLTFLGPAAGDECSARTGLLFMGQGAAGEEEEIVVRVHRLARCSWRAAGPGGRTNSIFVVPGIYMQAGRASTCGPLASI
jgi:hypothetical protein